jgi:hypothetical protein
MLSPWRPYAIYGALDGMFKDVRLHADPTNRKRVGMHKVTNRSVFAVHGQDRSIAFCRVTVESQPSGDSGNINDLPCRRGPNSREAWSRV